MRKNWKIPTRLMSDQILRRAAENWDRSANAAFRRYYILRITIKLEVQQTHCCHSRVQDTVPPLVHVYNMLYCHKINDDNGLQAYSSQVWPT